MLYPSHLNNIDNHMYTASWGNHFTPPTKRSLDEILSDPDTDSEWYVKKIKLYRYTPKTELKKLGIPYDPRVKKNMKRVFEGFQNQKIITKLDLRTGFDHRKIKHIDLVEYDKVGFWGRRW